ncbi:MAG: LysE family transporter [Thermodesulfobacteriota bacterium]
MDFQTLSGLLEVFGLGLLVGMVPGPDFFVVVKNALQGGGAKGRATALGIGAGLLIHVGYSVLGLALVLQNAPHIFQTIQAIGGIYLLWLAVQTLRASLRASSPPSVSPAAKKQPGHTQSKRVGFQEGFFCNVLNPKAALFFISIFSTYITPNTSWLIHWVYGLEIVLAVTLWFFLVSRIAASERFRRLYAVVYVWIDRAFVLVLVYFGLKVLWP